MEWVVYFSCISILTLCGVSVWESFHPRGSASSAALKSLEKAKEVAARESTRVENWNDYPPGWEILKEPPRPSNREWSFSVDTEEVHEALTQAAADLELKKEESAQRRRNPPLLEIFERNRQARTEQTFRETVWEEKEEPLQPPQLQRQVDFPAIGAKTNFPQKYQADKMILPRKASVYDTRQGLRIIQLFNARAKQRLAEITRDIRDYTCILYKWDQTNIISQEMDVMHLLIREKPFSVYARFEHPKKVQGREWIYWEGHYDQKIVVNSGPKAFNRTLLLEVDSPAIQNSSSHPVTDMGFRPLLQQLIDVSNDLDNLKDAHVQYYPQAKVGDRPCYGLVVSFQEKHPRLTFHKIEIFIDQEWELPIRVVMYDWPRRHEEKLPILEEYTYVLQSVNTGLTDQDFCHRNPRYGFKKYVARLSSQEAQFMESVMNR
ncbi:MAG: DUF1571 domain-containing protein [Planctomycetia bacterium]|nr:DUF1571 domain-containing protein [Planctomycetia bacterium]